MTPPPPAIPVRTINRPMAFTPLELLTGGLLAWASFSVLVPLLLLGWVVLTIPVSAELTEIGTLALTLQVILFASVAAMVLSFAVSMLLLLAVWPIARALRTVRGIGAHLLVYCALGTAVGGLYVLITGMLLGPGSLGPGSGVLLVPAIAATIAVPLGWWLSANHALRRDARRDAAWRDPHPVIVPVGGSR